MLPIVTFQHKQYQLSKRKRTKEGRKEERKKERKKDVHGVDNGIRVAWLKKEIPKKSLNLKFTITEDKADVPYFKQRTRRRQK